MNSSQAETLALVPHVSTSERADLALAAQVHRAPDGLLTLTYSVTGDLARIRLPPPRPPCRADGLWHHTCFEAFVAPIPGPGYFECNFSPSGEWAIYAFTAYRAGMAVAGDVEARVIAIAQKEGRLTVEASVSLAQLRDRPLDIALASVIEDERGALSYYALQHPPGKPDFHHPDGFAFQTSA